MQINHAVALIMAFNAIFFLVLAIGIGNILDELHKLNGKEK